ncbi:type I-E CRISPR-associated protein Cse2/CasB [Gilliamella sp. B2776]|uniref:type I-E CRISPR-associated protein Cse2/CasB n=1 Tax=unclassified Gilliamella TaxID=2685620 RepID=UPI00226A49C1|nr:MULTISPECIES: type I-E CRISPR-associated protein Cse2/CasB [unclassified Gilliamella]MCX8648784.1 type I-E CRISPR-associated protein Cse2/CasB [Gilliamella sp. B2779]MCX8653340.1 type I-E CRISPR-associated protein Cse2/CasB [Gilliamella sp. B2737]MCX8655616.1 type I-E CRISPR-associated protein Cse2/CasB [Gilliamella sp. B2894]MCX8664366.1 type I-E CRISPR-associated protein Cse2/CasB [Gilliamella sp. B2887]MCX8690596.1 type I-E CRISPR-associated protein Cse2/CasB [Gilliamella sp. B2776]
MSNNLIKRTIILNESHKRCIDEWFSVLQQRSSRFNGASYNGRQLKAELRRTSLPYGVILQTGYFILADALFSEEQGLRSTSIHQEALAIFVAVAAFVSESNDKKSFAEQLGEKTRGGQHNTLSPLRFEQLQASSTPEEFCRRLIRAVKSRGDNGINLFSLADGIFLWVQEWHDRLQNLSPDINPFRRLSVRWAMEYYSTKKSSKE